MKVKKIWLDAREWPVNIPDETDTDPIVNTKSKTKIQV
jgi:hypothetical protein